MDASLDHRLRWLIGDLYTRVDDDEIPWDNFRAYVAHNIEAMVPELVEDIVAQEPDLRDTAARAKAQLAQIQKRNVE